MPKTHFQLGFSTLFALKLYFYFSFLSLFSFLSFFSWKTSKMLKHWGNPNKNFSLPKQLSSMSLSEDCVIGSKFSPPKTRPKKVISSFYSPSKNLSKSSLRQKITLPGLWRQNFGMHQNGVFRRHFLEEVCEEGGHQAHPKATPWVSLFRVLCQQNYFENSRKFAIRNFRCGLCWFYLEFWRIVSIFEDRWRGIIL